jgi:hypothetical protein
VKADGEVSICIDARRVLVERWTKPLQSPNRVSKLEHQMRTYINIINADIERDLIIIGDREGNVVIQRMSTGRILFKKTPFFRQADSIFTCSSILENYLCLASNNHMIGTVDLKTFTKVDGLTFKYDSHISSLQICRVQNKAFVIATGM